MQSHTKFINLFVLACLISLTLVGLAQETAKAQREQSFPYVAEITEDNVNIRSGPGTNYYHCGKLSTGDRVKVVASKYSWSHIVPPEGSFSWISKQYISIEPNNPRIGAVTGDAVRVYAGSNFLKPMHSTTVQLELNRGDKVELMGEEMDDYYKIAPPSGAYLWVLTQYTKPVGAADKVEVIVSPKTATSKTENEPKATVSVPPVITASTPIEAAKLREYYALAGKIEAEQTKPMTEQNYTEIKKALAELAGNQDAGKAARYAEFALKQIGRCELAVAVDQAVKFQDSQLQNIDNQIENARSTELAKIPELGEFAAIGQFQTSKIYGPEESLKHYRIIDDSEQTICYALPEGSASQMDLSKFEGRKVGLVGTIEPHPQTKGALVRFTQITELE
jgi:uncharacterized protein YgiM (DUF1202 family)